MDGLTQHILADANVPGGQVADSGAQLVHRCAAEGRSCATLRAVVEKGKATADGSQRVRVVPIGSFRASGHKT